MRFDHVLIADWSAASRPTSATRLENSIWIGEAGGGEHHFRTRFDAETWLSARLAALSGQRVLLGFDFAFAWPTGFARRLTGQADPRAVWGWLAEHLTDGPDNANNRFALAAAINRRFPTGPGPFWSRPAAMDLPDLPPRRHGIDHAGHGLAEHRAAEMQAGAKSVWMLTNPGAVGSQSLKVRPFWPGLTVPAPRSGLSTARKALPLHRWCWPKFTPRCWDRWWHSAGARAKSRTAFRSDFWPRRWRG